MFSPYYALARARGRGDPTNHVAMNVALYGTPSRWAMTERGRSSLSRDTHRLQIGQSAMAWDGDSLTITLDEINVPVPTRLRGTITLRPRGLTDEGFALDGAGRHRWHPIAPVGDVTVALASPALRWRGTGYFDTNTGDEPLEAAFRSWTWSRFDCGDRARIAYDVVERDGAQRSLSLSAGSDGRIEAGAALAYHPLKRGLWGIERFAPSDPGTAPVLLKTLEDAPFYMRSAIRSRIDGADAFGIHESLSLDRARAPWVRMLLPFRMPRRG